MQPSFLFITIITIFIIVNIIVATLHGSSDNGITMWVVEDIPDNCYSGVAAPNSERVGYSRLDSCMALKYNWWWGICTILEGCT